MTPTEVILAAPLYRELDARCCGYVTPPIALHCLRPAADPPRRHRRPHRAALWRFGVRAEWADRLPLGRIGAHLRRGHPVIAGVRAWGCGHGVAVTGLDFQSGGVLLGNPGWFRRGRLSWRDFERQRDTGGGLVFRLA